MSYRKAEEILPRELIEAIQQYVDGESIYIPSKEKQDWGTKSNAKRFFRERNESIYEGALRGMGRLSLPFVIPYQKRAFKGFCGSKR